MREHQLLATPAVADASVRSDYSDAKSGDVEAVLSLHATLAEYLRAGKITPYMIDLLARMHEAIAEGMSADDAMLTRPPSGRPPNLSRDARIHAFIAHRKAAYRFLEANVDRLAEKLPTKPTMKEVYKKASEQFEVTPRVARDVYLEAEKRNRPTKG